MGPLARRRTKPPAHRPAYVIRIGPPASKQRGMGLTARPAVWPATVPLRISRAPGRLARTGESIQRSERMKQAWMGSVALATALLCVVPDLVQAQEDITVTDKSFGCIRDGTKVRNTYIRNADPQRLAEAVRILRDRVANTEYPVGTFLQLVPGEAMVKHPKATFRSEERRVGKGCR